MIHWYRYIINDSTNIDTKAVIAIPQVQITTYRDVNNSNDNDADCRNTNSQPRWKLFHITSSWLFCQLTGSCR